MGSGASLTNRHTHTDIISDRVYPRMKRFIIIIFFFTEPAAPQSVRRLNATLSSRPQQNGGDGGSSFEPQRQNGHG